MSNYLVNRISALCCEVLPLAQQRAPRGAWVGDHQGLHRRLPAAVRDRVRGLGHPRLCPELCQHLASVATISLLPPSSGDSRTRLVTKPMCQEGRATQTPTFQLPLRTTLTRFIATLALLGLGSTASKRGRKANLEATSDGSKEHEQSQLSQRYTRATLGPRGLCPTSVPGPGSWFCRASARSRSWHRGWQSSPEAAPHRGCSSPTAGMLQAPRRGQEPAAMQGVRHAPSSPPAAAGRSRGH